MTTLPASVAAHFSEQDKRTLFANRWFASLSGSQQKALLDASRAIRLSEGQLFASQGQALRKKRDGFGVLVSGLLKVSSTSTDGREAILSFVRPGQWFGELSVLDGTSRERDFLSVGISEILVIESEAMQSLLQDVQLSHQITRLLASRTRMLLNLVESFTLRSSLSRTARRLVMLAYDDEPESGQHRSTLDVSQDALASMLGMTRQSVASQLRQLSDRGAISQAYGSVKISSMVALMAEAA
ncbi:Crp/Fnr family transcriptional regulator [Variovorax sp. PCZ-1]|uniref:Crp/Fnr family transcriptional regulator n=1 Tax=Variovorax sp. PCZ-1 TaxID=2835533 RepID=UPI001BD12B36|nr:Crp/Fnr family transcriptional regulator [Variovorax sp. PCZ-1]MBS7806251.1 Crp/Fnr family transcriptional regulator [Variovorax sp. PCZ-1]